MIIILIRPMNIFRHKFNMPLSIYPQLSLGNTAIFRFVTIHITNTSVRILNSFQASDSFLLYLRQNAYSPSLPPHHYHPLPMLPLANIQWKRSSMLMHIDGIEWKLSGAQILPFCMLIVRRKRDRIE